MNEATLLPRTLDLIHQINWRPQIGDPNIMGWVTVAAYVFAAVTAFYAARMASEKGASRPWIMVGVLMFLLCINKQLDLQTLLTEIGRVIAKNQGWYGERRSFQKWFVLGILATSGLLTFAMAWRHRCFWKSHVLLGVGLSFLLTFILVRAVSFHHVDVMLRTTFVGVKMNWFLELTGIALVWLASLGSIIESRNN